MDKKTIYKTVFFLILLVSAFYIGSNYVDVSKESIRNYVDGFGIWAPVAHVFIYAIGISLLLPGTLFTAAGSVSFGTFLGYVYNLMGAMAGASLSFCIAKLLGKDFVDKFLKGKTKKYNDLLEKEGFSTIFYLRLVFAPFSPLNFVAGLTRIKFKDFFFGTLLGILPGTFILTFFFDQITSISHFTDLLQWEVLFGIGLFVFSFFIPFFVKKYKTIQHNS